MKMHPKVNKIVVYLYTNFTPSDQYKNRIAFLLFTKILKKTATYNTLIILLRKLHMIFSNSIRQ